MLERWHDIIPGQDFYLHAIYCLLIPDLPLLRVQGHVGSIRADSFHPITKHQKNSFNHIMKSKPNSVVFILNSLLTFSYS